MTGNQAFILASGDGGGMTREEVIELIHETVKTPMHFKGLVGEGGDILDLPSPLNKDGDTYLVNADGYYANLPAMYYKVKTTHVEEDWAVGDPIRVDIWAGIDDTFVTYTEHAITPSFKLNDPGPYYPNPVYSPAVFQYTYLNTNTFQIWAKTEGIIIEGRTIELNNEVDYWYTDGTKDVTVFKIDGGTTFAKKGDMFCSVGDKWILIPSGDEAAGGNMDYAGNVTPTTLPAPSQAIKGKVVTASADGEYTLSNPKYIKFDPDGSGWWHCDIGVYSDFECTELIDSYTYQFGGTPFTIADTITISGEGEQYVYTVTVNCSYYSNGAFVSKNVGDTVRQGIGSGAIELFKTGTTASLKKGDTLVCNGESWVVQNTHVVNSNYSTEEQDTGKLWVDGTSHVYTRSFSGTIANGSITDILSTGVANITIINATGFFYNTSGLAMSLGQIPSASQWGAALHVRDDAGTKKLALMASTELYNGSYNATIEYIKNT